MKEKLNLLVLASLASVVIDSHFKDLSEAILKFFFQEEDRAAQEGEKWK